jgi:HlyD family secretion protein
VSAAFAQVQAAGAAVQAAEARIASARTAVQHTQVKAPIAGVVWKVHVTVGQSLAEGALKVADIADMSTLYIDADVSESKLGVAGVGMPVDIVLDAFPNRHYDGRVVELRPEVNKDTATGVVRLELIGGGPDVLLNMSARVSFLKRAVPLVERAGASKISVPASAVVERDGAPVVFVFSGGVAAKLKVQKGDGLGSDVEIASGLKVGERVVLAPPAELEDGRALELLP